MAGIEELLVSIVSKFDDAGFKKLDASTTKASKATTFLSNNLRNLFVGIIGTIGVREIVNATVKMDSLRTSMNALAGSEVGGFEQIEFLRKETNRLGQDFLTTADAYKNLFSSGKGAGMSDNDIQSIFSGVLEAGTVLGSSQQQMQGALTALEQMISKGKVSTQELRLQLGNALPGAMQIAARAMGVTNQEFQKMLESGLDSQKFVMAFANQLHTEFGGKAVDASHTLRAELARLQNSLFNLESSLMDREAGEAFADVIRQLTNALNSPEMKTGMNAIAKFLTFVLQHTKEIALIVGILLGNRALGSLAKGVVGAGKSLTSGFRFFATIAKFTQNLTFLPRLLGILRLAWLALSPLAKLQLILMAVIAISTIVGKLWSDKVKKDQAAAKKTEPNIVRLSDGRYVDINTNSPTFGKIGNGYNMEDVAKLLYGNNSNTLQPFNLSGQKQALDDWLNPTNPAKLMWRMGQIEQKTNNTLSIGSLSITAKTDDPKDFGLAFKFEMQKFLDSFAQGQGFSTPRIRF